MAHILRYKGITTRDISPAEMLTAIAEEEPKNVFVLVWPDDGSMPTYHSSTGDTAVVMLRLQEFIHKFYNGDFG